MDRPTVHFAARARRRSVSTAFMQSDDSVFCQRTHERIVRDWHRSCTCCVVRAGVEICANLNVQVCLAKHGMGQHPKSTSMIVDAKVTRRSRVSGRWNISDEEVTQNGRPPMNELQS